MDISDKLALPPVRNIRLRSEVDFYGLSTIIARQLGLRHPRRSFATWRHGWVHPPLEHVPQLIWHDHHLPCHLVATVQEAAFLQAHGIGNAVAAGLPFIYSDIDGVERIPGSLLVMPPHSLPYLKAGVHESNYIRHIQGIADQFAKVVFCIHQDCVGWGFWINALDEAGFDWVTGASAPDENSLIRMQTLFRSFEYMTTCAIGSHLVYAAYCGSKVSISGSYFQYQKESFRDDPISQRFPELLTHNMRHSSEQAVRERFPFLFTDPSESVTLLDWAREQAGYANRRDARELKEYLGWSLGGQLRGYARQARRKAGKLFGKT